MRGVKSSPAVVDTVDAVSDDASVSGCLERGGRGCEDCSRSELHN